MSDFEIVGCCGMCDDECDCVNTRTCLADWQQQARRAEDALDAARAEAAGLRRDVADMLGRISALTDSADMHGVSKGRMVDRLMRSHDIAEKALARLAASPEVAPQSSPAPSEPGEGDAETLREQAIAILTWQERDRAARAEAAGLRERLAALCAEAETNPSPLDPTRGYVAVSRVRAALRVDR